MSEPGGVEAALREWAHRMFPDVTEEVWVALLATVTALVEAEREREQERWRAALVLHTEIARDVWQPLLRQAPRP